MSNRTRVEAPLFIASLSVILGASPLLAVGTADGTVPTVQAVQAGTAIEIDGRLQEEAWRSAPPATEFWQRDPDEGERATERTELRVLYDNNAIYVGLRMFDREPDKVTRRLSRRDDEWADADRVIVNLDPRHDHLTGASFEVTAAGVRRDAILYDDTRRDDSWDGVWHTAVSTDAEGWTAELRIPFSQLRFSASEETWGINVSRVIRRKNEETWLVLVPKNERGVVSRMGHLAGLENINPKTPLELLPYSLTRAEFVAPEDDADPFNDGSRTFAGVGLDAKWGLTGNVTMDATVNPDFGQVELDPEVINLTTMETFFPEKRPFFTEGTRDLQELRARRGRRWRAGSWGRPRRRIHGPRDSAVVLLAADRESAPRGNRQRL